MNLSTEVKLMTNPRFLKLIIQSIIKNAFANAGAGASVVFNIYEESKKIVFSIFDNGPASEDENLISAFNNFFPAKKIDFSESLAMASSLVKLLGGEIGISRSVNENCITFSLPIGI